MVNEYITFPIFISMMIQLVLVSVLSWVMSINKNFILFCIFLIIGEFNHSFMFVSHFCYDELPVYILNSLFHEVCIFVNSEFLYLHISISDMLIKILSPILFIQGVYHIVMDTQNLWLSFSPSRKTEGIEISCLLDGRI